MSRISYLNSQFLPHEKCLVHIEDRGFQFGDGVYEVTLFKNGKLIDGDAHIDRLFRSLDELNISHNFSKDQIKEIQLQLFEKNNIKDEATCYLQITRGTTNRVQNCPKNLQPTILATCNLRKQITKEQLESGFKVITHNDIRWQRCDIKSVNLLASTLVNQKAKDSDFDDAIFIRDGIITEATFANVFIVTKDNILVTKNADNFILNGITRRRMIKIAQNQGIKLEERPFNLQELLSAKEVFLTSSSLILRPVVRVDNSNIGNGKVGAISKMLLDCYNSFIG